LGREAYRNLKPRLRRGYDLILLVYPEDQEGNLRPAGSVEVSAPDFAKRMKQMEYLLTKADLLL
jgi:hypothetical protein